MEEKRVLIVGAGEAARMILSEISRNDQIRMEPVGLLDDDEQLIGSYVDSVPVLGKTDSLQKWVREKNIDEIIIAIPTARGSFVRGMIHQCNNAGVPYKIVPGLMGIIKGDVSINQIREVRIEDLLGRETVEFDIELMESTIAGKKVLVTGAGGTIGRELCCCISRSDPEELILLGRGENRIFNIEEELRSKRGDLAITTVINNLRDMKRTENLIRKLSPDIVYHTAAHKHVHYMERDPAEAVINNVGVTLNLMRACENNDVSRFVFISTDKAANPRGVMGATKRIMERFLSARRSGRGCRFISVRFGNVIGSAGSVVPLFIRQIRRGGPVTVSNPEATRYFMTVKEAALLVLRASAIGKGGEIFILDMGEALNIHEMARDIIILSGHEPGAEIPIEFTGLREGEKMHEELVSGDEELVPSGEKKIMVAESSASLPAIEERDLERMLELASQDRDKELLTVFSELLPGFKSAER
ncbi:MAG: NAD-dependent epimerase/dehydratase family protein [Candidatus Latescibacteria bacterium]|nr:NAD-dependent epimerase/dehydratase family protein [bacterium]MBD3422874.1 NAD-dependent epimerase/dehydratase family protein [Candidatus Latescibacterota bacterium]